MVKRSNVNNHCQRRKCKEVMEVAVDTAAVVGMAVATEVAMGADMEVDTVVVMAAATVVAVRRYIHFTTKRIV